MRKILIFLVFFLNSQILFADSSHFIDFKFILNESNAGKKAQDALKSQLQNGLKNLKEREKRIQEDEKKIIQQKKLISAEDYKKQVKELRSKVTSLQKERNKLLDNISNHDLLYNLMLLLHDLLFGLFQCAET